MTHEDLIKSIESNLAGFDAKVLESELVWAKARCEAVQKVRDEQRQNRNLDQYSIYGQRFAAAGGKTWYAVFQYGYGPRVEEFMIKNAEVRNNKRNAKIAKKLKDAGVIEVTNADVKYHRSGFDGVYDVMTNVGPKKVVIETIFAGGYNIQCAHLRVLVKVK